MTSLLILRILVIHANMEGLLFFKIAIMMSHLIEQEIQNIITSINGYITFEIDSMNVFNDDIELILFDINGRKIEYFPMIEFTSDHLMIDISNLNFGFYFIGLKSAFYWHYYKLFIDN